MPVPKQQPQVKQNKNKNIVPVSPAVSPDINSGGFNIGGNVLQTAQLMSALSGTPTTPPGVPMGTAVAPAPDMTGVPVGITPGDTGQQVAGTIVPMPVTNPPDATLTPIQPQTIMGMPPEQFAAMAGMLGSALAPNEYGPQGQLVPSALGKLGELSGGWGLAQILAKKSGAPRTTIPRTGGM